tara:strand:+ start:74 stop:778 length:705 start_codon:yes stop_codon:yes gene_type:complete
MVSIDTVYQRVLVLANKEQRGYITPQEFNLFANQAQMDIFEQYFYDTNQFSRVPGNDTSNSDPIEILNDKIDIFKKSYATPNNALAYSYSIPSDYYRVDHVQLMNHPDGARREIERISHRENMLKSTSPLLKATNERPSYYIKGDVIHIQTGSIIPRMNLIYIKEPEKAEWSGYSVSGSELYDSTNTVDFELHTSEETKLVIKILQLAGIAMKDPNLYQVGGAEDNKNIQQEKQ